MYWAYGIQLWHENIISEAKEIFLLMPFTFTSLPQLPPDPLIAHKLQYRSANLPTNSLLTSESHLSSISWVGADPSGKESSETDTP